MIPLRNALIVKEHGILPYPEGKACADVLLAGENGGASAKMVFIGMGFAAVIKFIVDGIKIVPGVISAKLDSLRTDLSTEVYPALIGVGYICGPKISSNMLAGGILGWFVLIVYHLNRNAYLLSRYLICPLKHLFIGIRGLSRR